MEKITTCLWFDFGEAEKAAKFYISIFKGRSKIKSITRYPKGSPGNAKGVMTVELTLEGRHFTLLAGGPHFRFNEAISLVVTCKNQKEIDYYWKALQKGGGSESMCGWLKDRYGLSWQIVPKGHEKLFTSKDPKANERAMAAMLRMRKLDMAAMEAAFRGDE